MEATADDRQVGGSHYKDKAIQPWDAMKAWMSPEQFKGFLRGNVIRYIARCDDKGGVEDLKKCAHYLDKLIEHEEECNAELDI
jgi:hypothetical protein